MVTPSVRSRRVRRFTFYSATIASHRVSPIKEHSTVTRRTKFLRPDKAISYGLEENKNVRFGCYRSEVSVNETERTV